MVYTPEKTRLAEKKIAATYDGPKFEGPIAIHIVLDTEGTAVIIEPVDVDEKSKLRGDIDNYAKTVLDGLNGVAFDDDIQVVKLGVIKL